MKEEILELMNDLEQYMDDRADIVDGRSGTPVANKEMVLLNRIQEAIKQIENTWKYEEFVKGFIQGWEDGAGGDSYYYRLAKIITK